MKILGYAACLVAGVGLGVAGAMLALRKMFKDASI